MFQGVAYTFFTYANAPKAKDLIKVLEEANQSIPPELHQMAKDNFNGGRGRSVTLVLVGEAVMNLNESDIEPFDQVWNVGIEGPVNPDVWFQVLVFQFRTINPVVLDMVEVINEAMAVVVMILPRGPDLMRQHDWVMVMAGDEFCTPS